MLHFFLLFLIFLFPAEDKQFFILYIFILFKLSFSILRAAMPTQLFPQQARSDIEAVSYNREYEIPPCGAISVQLNAMESAPATADPAIQAGST